MATYRKTKLDENSTREEVKAALDKGSIPALQAFDLLQQIKRREDDERIDRLTRGLKP